MPEDVVNEVYKRIKLPTADPAVWLHLFPQADAVMRARELLKTHPDPAIRHPLFGIPFSIKDSIDIKGLPTTAACPEYAYIAEKDAASYAKLIDAGCIAIGKVNLVKLFYNCVCVLLFVFIISRKGSTCNWPRWNAVTLWSTGFCVFLGLRLRWIILWLMRVGCLQPSIFFVGHRYSWLGSRPCE